MKNQIETEASPKAILEIANSFKQSRILLTAFELDIFSVLDKHLLSSGDVAAKIGTEERSTDRLMNALTALGFLRKTKNKFYNSQCASNFLVKGKPKFMGGLYHTANLWDNWSTLTEAVRKGGRVDIDKSTGEEENWLESFIGAMHYRAKDQAKILCYMIDFSNVNKMLDLGGGSGAFAMGFIRAHENVHATIFDLLDVIPITKRYVAEENLTDKIDYIEGNYLTDDLGSDFDLIFLSAIIHSNSESENVKLINKCYEALNDGGQIVISDFIMDEDRTSPAHGAVFALNMLVGTKHGDTYTESEVSDWMSKVGFNSIERKETGFNTSLIIGKKK